MPPLFPTTFKQLYAMLWRITACTVFAHCVLVTEAVVYQFYSFPEQFPPWRAIGWFSGALVSVWLGVWFVFYILRESWHDAPEA